MECLGPAPTTHREVEQAHSPVNASYLNLDYNFVYSYLHPAHFSAGLSGRLDSLGRSLGGEGGAGIGLRTSARAER